MIRKGKGAKVLDAFHPLSFPRPSPDMTPLTEQVGQGIQQSSGIMLLDRIITYVSTVYTTSVSVFDILVRTERTCGIQALWGWNDEISTLLR